MERPSHSIATLTWHKGSHRVTGLGLSFFLQSLLGLVLIGGFVAPAVNPFKPIEVPKIDDNKDVQALPPPEPKTIKLETPTADKPIITVDAGSSGDGITTVIRQQATEPPGTMITKPPTVAMVPDRAAIGIAATHSTPPYPTLARRLGAEGKVTLRLSIQADGKVARAEVVTSSGRHDLDEAAQGWIVSHWTYQPAIKDGVPAASQALAAVNFSLTNP
jgi:protein TonB